jgi:hypothetical protein
MQYRSSVAGALALSLLFPPAPSVSWTSYEAQLLGQVYGILAALVIGEFGGRTVASENTILGQRICRLRDYDDLRKAAKDNKTLIAFRRECDLVESRSDKSHVHSTVYLPTGYCEKLKNAFEAMLAKTYAQPEGPLDIEHNEMRYKIMAHNLDMIRRAKLRATCDQDGALVVSAPKR